MKRNKKGLTFLGKGSEWEGKVNFHGTIKIDSHFKGEITSNGTLILGEEGLIEGHIHCSHVVIRGELHGDIIADHRVDLHAPGKIFGNIHSPSIVIDEGVIFEGTTQMYQAKDGAARKPVLVKSDLYTGSPPPTLTAIHGLVTDQITGKPIKNAFTKCKGRGNRNTNTNASGYYELINLEDGKWRVKIKAKGYKKGMAIVEISGGGTYQKNFALKPKRRMTQ
jgi:cytoskeletal protein CcmA (bactofilin family)